MSSSKKGKGQDLKRISQEARSLIKDPLFFHRAMKMIGECGVVRELKNRLILFLSGLSKEHGEPVSILVKGSTSAGKSNLVSGTIALFPPESVSKLASLSKKAPLFGEDSVDGKILYFLEYCGAKDAQFLIRLQQSEGIIAHEFTTIAGRHRSIEVSQRTGFPVIWTTTTKDRVFEDDETRYLSLAIDESSTQTLAIVKAQIKGKPKVLKSDVAVWREAVRLLAQYEPEARFPDWFGFVATKLPVAQVRVRRDWKRFLAFLKVIAKCRTWSDSKLHPKKVTVDFADYCAGYALLEKAFASTVYGLPERTLSVARACRTLYTRFQRPVTAKELAGWLRWKESLVYKYVAKAVKASLIKHEAGTTQTNLKRLIPVPGPPKIFLPSPHHVFAENPQIGKTASYVHPISGQTVTFDRKKNAKTLRRYRRNQ